MCPSHDPCKSRNKVRNPYRTTISKISNLHLQALGLRCLHMIAGIIIKTGICKDKHRHK